MPAAQPSAALVFCSGVFVSFSVLPSCGLLCCPGFFVSWCFVSFLCFFSVPLFLVFLPPSVFFGSLVFSLSPFPRSQGVVFPVFELAPFCSWFLFPVTKKKFSEFFSSRRCAAAALSKRRFSSVICAVAREIASQRLLFLHGQPAIPHISALRAPIHLIFGSPWSADIKRLLRLDFSCIRLEIPSDFALTAWQLFSHSAFQPSSLAAGHFDSLAASQSL